MFTKVKKLQLIEYDQHSKEGVLSFESQKGKILKCYYQGEMIEEEIDQIKLSYFEAEYDSIDQLFSKSQTGEKIIESIGLWDYSVKGEVIEVNDSIATIDLGEVYIELLDVTNSIEDIGKDIEFIIYRLEAELEYKEQKQIG